MAEKVNCTKNNTSYLLVYNNSLGYNKELRKKKNVDAKDLAQRIGIDISNLSRIEFGKYSVGLDVLSKIANALYAKVELVENNPSETSTKV